MKCRKVLDSGHALKVRATGRKGDMLKTFLTLVGASVVISFHESLWAWALVPMGVALLMVLVGLQLERREVERGGR